MTRPFPKDPVLIFALAAATAGGALALSPPPRWDVPPFASDDAHHSAEADSGAADLTRLARLFDLANLPPPAPPIVPPPDPAAALKRYHYLGNAAAGDRQRALFEVGGSVRVLAPGEALEGFSLTRIDHDSAIFVKDEVEVALPLSAE